MADDILKSNKSTIVEVFTSYDQIRKVVTDNLLNQLGLSETDLHRGTFVAYLIDVVSHLTSNLMFFSSMNYRENFLTLAQLPESVYALSAFLGYKPSTAEPPSCSVLITIPLQFKEPITLVLSPGLKFFAGDITYLLRDRVDIYIDQTNSNYNIVTTDPTTDSKYAIPYSIVDNNLAFSVIADQKAKLEFDFITNPNLQIYQFSNYSINFQDQLAGIEVYVDDKLWTEFDSMYLMRPYDEGYVVRLTSDGATIYFGNGIFGKQPPKNVPLRIVVYTTKGTEGAIVSHAIKSCDRVYYKDSEGTKIVKLSVTNLNASTKGSNIESIDDVRRNALLNIQALNRVVSKYDYENIGTIAKLPIEVAYPILKRSDLKCNEITTYTVLVFEQDIVPTRTIPSPEVDLSSWTCSPYTPIQFEDYNYYCPFEIVPDLDTKLAHYVYYVRHVQLNLTAHDVNLVDYTIVPTQCDIRTDYDNKKVLFNITCNLSSNDDITNYYATLTIKRDDLSSTYDLDLDANNSTFSLALELYKIPYSKLSLTLEIYDKNTNDKVGLWTTFVIIKQRLDEIIFSNFTWTDEIYNKGVIHEIPVILSDWYDELDEIQKVEFEQEILQTFIDGLSTSIYRTLNSSLNIKFADTYAKVTIRKEDDENNSNNTSSSSSSSNATYTIDAMYIKNPSQVESIPPGEYFLISSEPDPTYTNSYGNVIPNPFASHPNELAQQVNFTPVVHRILPSYKYGCYFYSDNATLSDGAYILVDSVPLSITSIVDETRNNFIGNDPITSHTIPVQWPAYLTDTPAQLWDEHFVGTLCKVDKVDIDKGNFYASLVNDDAGNIVGVIGVFTPDNFPVSIDKETSNFKDWVAYPAIYCYEPFHSGAPKWELFTYDFNDPNYHNDNIWLGGIIDDNTFFGCTNDGSITSYDAQYNSAYNAADVAFTRIPHGRPFIIKDGKKYLLYNTFNSNTNYLYLLNGTSIPISNFSNSSIGGIYTDITGQTIACCYIIHSGYRFIETEFTLDGTLIDNRYSTQAFVDCAISKDTNIFIGGSIYSGNVNYWYPITHIYGIKGFNFINKIPAPWNTYNTIDYVPGSINCITMDYVNGTHVIGHVGLIYNNTGYATPAVYEYDNQTLQLTELFDARKDLGWDGNYKYPHVSTIRDGIAYITVFNSNTSTNELHIVNLLTKSTKSYNLPTPTNNCDVRCYVTDNYIYITIIDNTARIYRTYRTSVLDVAPDPSTILSKSSEIIKDKIDGTLYLNPITSPKLPTYENVTYLNDTTKCFIAFTDNSDKIPPLGSNPGTPDEWQQLGWKVGPLLDNSLTTNEKLTCSLTSSDIIYNDGLIGTTIRRLNPDGTGSLYFYQLHDGNIWDQIYGKIYWSPDFENLSTPTDPNDEQEWLKLGWLEVSNVKDGWLWSDTQLPNFIYQYVTDKWYIYTKPNPGDTLNISGTAVTLKYTGDEWIIPGITQIDLPFKIEATVYINTSYGTLDEIKQNIIAVLFQYFQPKFGIFASIYRSDIIRVIQSVPGVEYCVLTKPTEDIVFELDISKLDPSQLIDFVPPYIYFKDIDLTLIPYTGGVKP